MYDLDQPQDVIAEMRDGGMDDQDIWRVAKGIMYQLLTEQYQKWCKDNKFPLMSADELYAQGDIPMSFSQTTYLEKFLREWEKLDAIR